MIPFRYIDKALAFIGFTFLIGALNALLTTFDSTIGGADSSGNLKIQIFSMMIYVPSVFLIVHRLGRFLHLVSINIVIFLFLLLPIFSIFWSIAPDITMRRVIALVGTTIFISYIAIALTPVQALRVLATAFGAIALVSLIFAIALPGLGTHEAGPYAGVWRGLFAHKNRLGGMMTLAAATIAVCPKHNRKEIILGRICFMTAFFLVVMSQSKTALVILFCFLFLVPITNWASGRGLRTLERLIFAVIVAAACLTVLVQYTDDILEVLGKDATLTGRTETWSMAWDNVLDRPLLGYGYRVFWTDKSPARLAAVESWRDKISHSHNTYLDLALDLGFFGVVGFFIVISIFLVRLSKKIRKERDNTNLWMAIFTAYMLIVGITERSILEQSDIVWSVFILSYFYLSMKSNITLNKDKDIMIMSEGNGHHFKFNYPQGQR